MSEPSYFELLRHPKWQEKRLRIMERDRFRCAECGDKETTLNVHHGYYTKGAKPWEYPDESLRCLCEKCHERRHAILAEIKTLAGQLGCGPLEMTRGFLMGHVIEGRAGDEGVDPSSLTLLLAMTREAAYWQLIGVCAAYFDPVEFIEAVQESVDKSGRLARDAIYAALARTAGANAADPGSAESLARSEATRSLCGDCAM